MSAYEELVERCARAICADEPRIPWNEASAEDCRRASRAVLAEVRRTLETVTPEMEKADWWSEVNGPISRDAYLAMLRASPLSPP